MKLYFLFLIIIVLRATGKISLLLLTVLPSWNKVITCSLTSKEKTDYEKHKYSHIPSELRQAHCQPMNFRNFCLFLNAKRIPEKNCVLFTGYAISVRSLFRLKSEKAIAVVSKWASNDFISYKPVKLQIDDSFTPNRIQKQKIIVMRNSPYKIIARCVTWFCFDNFLFGY
jgi:hypothetical protein